VRARRRGQNEADGHRFKAHQRAADPRARPRSGGARPDRAGTLAAADPSDGTSDGRRRRGTCRHRTARAREAGAAPATRKRSRPVWARTRSKISEPARTDRHRHEAKAGHGDRPAAQPGWQDQERQRSARSAGPGLARAAPKREHRHPAGSPTSPIARQSARPGRDQARRGSRMRSSPESVYGGAAESGGRKPRRPSPSTPSALPSRRGEGELERRKR